MANNYDVALKMDIHDASQGTEDDWMFYGDLMAEYAMARNPKSLGTFAQLVHTAVPSYFPVQEDGSNYSFTSADGALHMKRWLRLFPGHFVALSFGTNDANSCISPDSFYKNYDTMVQAVLNAGKIPVIPTIPWGRTANIENCAPALNAKISSLYSVYSQIIHGPDLWSFFQAHQDMITGEAAPLTTAGIGSYRQQWADQMVKEVYALNVAAIDTPQLSLVPQQSPTPVPQQSPTPVPQQSPTSVLQLSPTPMPTLGSTATPTVTGGANAPSDGQGVYESCLPGDAACLAHLNIMASKGFKLVLNYSQLWASDTQEIAYADRAQALGMKVIWAMNDPAFRNGTDLRSYYSGLASTCNCSDNAGFIRYVVNLVKDLPGTWGYYIGDEVDSSNQAQVKAFSDLVHQADLFHPRLFIGSSALPAGVSSVLSPFADTADVLGLDYYPVGRTDIPNALRTDIPNAVNATAQIAKGMQAVDDQTDKQSAMVLQAISLGEYPQFSYTCRPYPSCVPYPTVDQMNLMYNLTMQNAHPRLVLWYSYFDILRSDNPAQH